MSGIAIRYEHASVLSEEERNHRLEAMAEALAHRGPDGIRCTQHGPTGMVQCQLFTTEEDALDHPPLRSRRGARWIVADARIDNRSELIDACDLNGEPLSDAALILHAYERWGDDCAAHLLGDFAFAIWDEKRNRIYCARDPLGVRQLYYEHRGGVFRCATEISALFADSQATPRPHLPSVGLYILGAYWDTGQTLYQDVFALPAAHHAIVEAGPVKLTRYWSPDPFRRLAKQTAADCAEQLHHALREAVACRMRSRGPIAAHVSGGMDSSAIAGVAAELHHEGQGSADPPTALHISFPGRAYDETKYSDAVASHWQLPTINSNALENLERAQPGPLAGCRDLFYDARLCMYRPLLEATNKRGIRTTLTGEGADFWLRTVGAEWADDLQAGRWSKVARESGLRAQPWSRTSWSQLWGGALRHFVPETARRQWRSWRPARAGAGILTESLALQVAQQSRAQRRLTSTDRYPDHVSRAMHDPLSGSILQNVLATWDRLAALHHTDFRYPFLDRRVVELLLATPHQHRTVVGMDKPKPVLRQAMRNVLPAEVLERTESAEASSYIEWVLFKQHGAKMKKLFSESRLARSGIITEEMARDICTNHQALNMLTIVYTLGMEVWMRQLTE